MEKVPSISGEEEKKLAEEKRVDKSNPTKTFPTPTGSGEENTSLSEPTHSGQTTREEELRNNSISDTNNSRSFVSKQRWGRVWGVVGGGATIGGIGLGLLRYSQITDGEPETIANPNFGGDVALAVVAGASCFGSGRQLSQHSLFRGAALGMLCSGLALVPSILTPVEFPNIPTIRTLSIGLLAGSLVSAGVSFKKSSIISNVSFFGQPSGIIEVGATW